VSMRSLLVTIGVALASASMARAAPEVHVSMTTTSGDSVLTPGETIVCVLDAGVYEVYGLALPMYVHYSNGNILGPLVSAKTLVASSMALQAFESVNLNNPSFECSPGSSQVSMLTGFTDFDDTGWTGSGVLFSIVSGASDTGTIWFEPADIPPVHFGTASVDSGNATVVWEGPVIVADPAFFTGSSLPDLRIRTHFGKDTLFAGAPSRLIFSVDPKHFELGEIRFPALCSFTNGNIIGPLRDGIEFTATGLATGAFDAIIWNEVHGEAATDPDTLYWTMYDLADTAGLTQAGDLATIAFIPKDTGTFIIDTTRLLPSNQLDCLVAGCPVGLAWEPLTVHVVPCPVRMGDCDESGVVNSADLIYLVNYVFKSGQDPLPMRTVGDVNCTGGLGASDIIFLVNYLFKSGPAPCGCYVRVI